MGVVDEHALCICDHEAEAHQSWCDACDWCRCRSFSPAKSDRDALAASIQRVRDLTDGAIEAFIDGNPARPNEYGYYLLQQIRSALDSVAGESPVPEARK